MEFIPIKESLLKLNLMDMFKLLIQEVNNHPNLKNKITSIRTGGQTGIDEAGAKAGLRLGIPTTVLAPKGWTFRDINSKDISNEKQFKDRFLDKIQLVSEEKLNIYAGTNENAELSNFAIRPFDFEVQQNNNAGYMGKKSFQSVEQAFQWHKVQYADTVGMGGKSRNEIAQEILNTTDGSKLRKLGKDFYLTKFRDRWDKASSVIMKICLKLLLNKILKL
jgi:hypothetical protein